MKNASQIVRDQGGWKDNEALKGSLKLFARSILLSAGVVGHTRSDDERPWTMRCPRTDRVLYTELEYTWADTIEKSWAEFKTALADAD